MVKENCQKKIMMLGYLDELMNFFIFVDGLNFDDSKKFQINIGGRMEWDSYEKKITE